MVSPVVTYCLTDEPSDDAGISENLDEVGSCHQGGPAMTGRFFQVKSALLGGADSKPGVHPE
jgi:ABC-type xylose transport system permease subunit